MSVSGRPAADVLRLHGKSFYFASWLLTPAFRLRSAQLYQFCRYVDDLVDESDNIAESSTKLQHIRDSLCADKVLTPEAEPIIQLKRQYGLPLDPILSLLDGVASDTTMTQLPDEESLIQYAYSVAGTVGLLMCSVLEVKDHKAYPFAVDLGIAMQLTNIARDVGEDATKNRIYLPASWVGTLNKDHVLNPDAQQRVAIVGGIKQLLELAQQYYQSGLSGLSYLPTDARKGILLAANIYAEIGQVIKDNDYRSWVSRATVSTPKKCWVAVRSIASYTLGNHIARKPTPTHNAKLHRYLAGFVGCSHDTTATPRNQRG